MSHGLEIQCDWGGCTEQALRYVESRNFRSPHVAGEVRPMCGHHTHYAIALAASSNEYFVTARNEVSPYTVYESWAYDAWEEQRRDRDTHYADA